MDHACSVSIIEEEPAHEFYANLIGNTKPPSFPPYNTNHGNEQQTQPSTTEIPTGANVIPNEVERKDDDSESSARAPKSIYRRFLDHQPPLQSPSPPPPRSKLTLGVDNPGFRMLTRMGWDESEGGLGRSRQGRLEPVLANPATSLGFGKT